MLRVYLDSLRNIILHLVHVLNSKLRKLWNVFIWQEPFRSSYFSIVKMTVVMRTDFNEFIENTRFVAPSRWRSRLERSPCMRKVGCPNPNRDRPKLYKQVVTATLS